MNPSETKTWKVQETEAGQRLDVFLAHHLTVPRSKASRLAAGSSVNEKSSKAGYPLKAGDVVQCRIVTAEETSSSRAAPPAKFDMPPVLFEDEHLLVLNKPRGLSVHAGAGEKQTTLVDVLLENGTPLSASSDPERAGIVHRLDKNTCGVMVVCKTAEAHQLLAADFAERRIKKTYQALVCGVPAPEGRIEAPIFRHPVKRKQMAVVATGRPAITAYKVLLSWPQFALVEVGLLTGRTHQIRVHFNYIHHPVVGDVLYNGYKRAIGSAKSETLKMAMKNQTNQALHAARITFEHPITKVLLDIEAPLPDDIQELIAMLNEEARNG